MYCSFIILKQIDLKKIVAYSSVIHMSYCIIGLFSFNFVGLVGSVLTMFSHGIISGALFFLVGSLYDKYHTRNILYYGGLALLLPVHATYFLLFSFANMSLPGLFSFVGELLILLGIVSNSIFLFGVLSMFTFFAVVYSVWLYNRVCFGLLKYKKPNLLGTKLSYYLKVAYDCSFIESIILNFLSGIVIIFGIFPEVFVTSIELAVLEICKFI